MTISELELCQATTSNIAKPSRFFPTKITVNHHQLRNFISTVEKNRIYYANNNDVWVFDLESQHKTLLASIPFEVRCLAADHGYICVGGGQNGDCAFIPLHGDEEVRLKPLEQEVVTHTLGGEIVNSMNIHLLLNDEGEAPEPVVLISNNDKTVKIYSLMQWNVLKTIDHPVYMNFAALSPNSTLLAAVGDSDSVYFHQRMRVDPPTTKPPQSTDTWPEYDWRPLAVALVPTGDAVYDDFSFAVAFSASGRLCASSSQGGCITVFDVTKLVDQPENPDRAIICSFRASRSGLFGCVRSITFSPEPWDILVWAEDHGRIGMADVRHYFVRRQILNLDQKAFKTKQMEDSTPEEIRSMEITDRLRRQRLTIVRPETSRDSSPLGLRRAQLLELQGASSLRRSTRQDLSAIQQIAGLDTRERGFIEAIESTLDDYEHVAGSPFSVNYAATPRFRPSQTSSTARRDYDVQLLNPGPRRSHPPRRRTSVILSESAGSHLPQTGNIRTRFSASPGVMTDDDDLPPPPMSTNDLTPGNNTDTSHPLPSHIPPDDPWHQIERHLNTVRQATAQAALASQDRPVTLARIEAALDAERRLAAQLERQLATERQLSVTLRQQLDAQDRVLRAQQRALEATQTSQVSVDPSLERLLYRSLESEQEFGVQRARELMTEIHLGENRARRLESERDRFLGLSSMARAGEPDTQDSARTTTLPTTNLRAGESTSSLSTVLQRHESFRRQRLAHIANLERQVRSAESRVALATSDIEALENAIQRRSAMERSNRQSDARLSGVTRATPNRDESVATGNRRLSGPLETAIGSRNAAATRREERSDRPNIGRPSELAGRVPESEMRLARLMFEQGSRTGIDANGNWMAAAGVQTMLGMLPTTSGVPTGLQEAMAEGGPGTAGLGFSPDGHYLYAGSQEGIFEFKINIRDRMTFPGIEMR